MRTAPLCARDAIVGDYSVLSFLVEQVLDNGSSDRIKNQVPKFTASDSETLFRT